MSRQTETGDICAAVYLKLLCQLRGIFIQRRHGLYCFQMLRFPDDPAFFSRREDSASQRLCQNQKIPRLCAEVFPHFFRMYKTSHTKAVLRFIIRDSMASGQDGSRLHNLIRPSFKDFPQNLCIQAVWKGCKVQSQLRLSSHGVYVA